MNPVEGIHYIFDRYAFLNSILSENNKGAPISTASTPEEIAKAVKYGRALYHPDRQARSGEQMKRQAETMSRLVDDCERFLGNPDLKPHYDAKLQQFKQENPHLVSENGNPIINLAEELLDVESLLSDEIVDTNDFETRVKTMLGFDDKETEQTESLFKAMPENPQIRSLHRSALTKKLTYLTLLEDAAWLKIGITGRKSKTDSHVLSGDEYLAKVEEALQTVATTRLDDEISQRGESARIGMSHLPLLLTFNQNTNSSPGTSLADPARLQEALDKLKVKARANFEIRAEYARDVARQKQAVLVDLVALAPTTPLNNHDDSSPYYDFYLTDGGDNGVVYLRLDLDVSTGNAKIAEVYSGKFSICDLISQKFVRNSFRVERNPEITDILIEVSGASERVFQEKKRYFAKPAADKAPIPKP
ncbi:MAG: hypothetical protein HYS17_08730 [Micavibrio aeruginosavorus]|uniref:J domain-containing protein n=1 Tax=Micavibrio aeruginosavorus TaxID=349221 RepID=A0A7T5R148_9BACT|nr:MAG: hypothetical protein HYS17_08730 [Micavibrio aeruginosavorus]